MEEVQNIAGLNTVTDVSLSVLACVVDNANREPQNERKSALLREFIKSSELFSKLKAHTAYGISSKQTWLFYAKYTTNNIIIAEVLLKKRNYLSAVVPGT